MKDRIFIRDLRVETRIGAFDWERQIRQIIVIDLELSTDIRKAARSDALADTIDYKAVSKRVCAFAAEAEFQLVETLGESLARLIIEEFDVPALSMTLNKTGAVRGARDVGVFS